MYIMLLYISKISNSVGRNDDFLTKVLEVFDIVRQHYVCILYLCNVNKSKILLCMGKGLKGEILLQVFSFCHFVFKDGLAQGKMLSV